MRHQQHNVNGLLRRGIHATSAVNGDALDMADTFSRRHGKLFVTYVHIQDVQYYNHYHQTHRTKNEL